MRNSKEVQKWQSASFAIRAWISAFRSLTLTGVPTVPGSPTWSVWRRLSTVRPAMCMFVPGACVPVRSPERFDMYKRNPGRLVRDFFISKNNWPGMVKRGKSYEILCLHRLHRKAPCRILLVFDAVYVNLLFYLWYIFWIKMDSRSCDLANQFYYLACCARIIERR